MIAGLVVLWRDRPVRAIAMAYPVMCAIVLATAGQPYYTAGLLVTLYTAGCVATERWLARGRRSRLRRTLIAATLTVACVTAAINALPLIPLQNLATTPIANALVNYQIGWPTYVQQVADVYHACPTTAPEP